MNHKSRAEGVAVVTGAAGSMGKATARALFDAGRKDLLLSDLSNEALEAIAGPLRSEGASVIVFAGDIADPSYPAGLIGALEGVLSAQLFTWPAWDHTKPSPPE